MLPFEFGATGISLNKADNRLPLMVASVAWYPIDSIEIEALFIPEFKTNRASLRRFLQKHHQVLTRISMHYDHWYGEWATIGLTYFRGWDQFAIEQNSGASVTNLDGDLRYTASNLKKSSFKKNVLALEVAKPFGAMVWKFELSYQDSIRKLNTITNEFNIQDDRLALFNWVQDQNGGKFFVDQKQLMVATGFDAEWNNWKANVTVGHVKLFLSKAASVGVDLSDAIHKDELWQEKYAIVGGINLNYFIDADKMKTIGLAGGMMGNGTGVLVYYRHKFNEEFSLIGSFEYAEFFSDMMEGDIQPYSGSDGSFQTQNKTFSPAFSIGLAYTL